MERIAYTTGAGTTIRGTLVAKNARTVRIRWDGFAKPSTYRADHPIAVGIRPA